MSATAWASWLLFLALIHHFVCAATLLAAAMRLGMWTCCTNKASNRPQRRASNHEAMEAGGQAAEEAQEAVEEEAKATPQAF